MFRNLHEVITDKIQQCHLMMQEQCKGFADNHDTVHAKLECHLSTSQLSTGIRDKLWCGNRHQSTSLPGVQSITCGVKICPKRADCRLTTTRSPRPCATDAGFRSGEGRYSEELTLALAPKWPLSLDFATCLLLSLDN